MHAANGKDSLNRLRESSMADLGELAGPLTHEVNNLLNNLSLHLALWQQTGSADLTDSLPALRRQIAHIANVMHRFQRRRHGDQLETTPLDLNTVLRDALTELSTQTPIVLELTPDLPGVRGHEMDIRRLCRFLLANALRALPAQGAVVVRTAVSEDGVALFVEDAGPDVPPETLLNLFEPGHEQREGMCCLELAACRSIVRRLRGAIKALARPGGGLIVAVTLPSATP
jgi:signal transduction histidine kinase